jgi:hypothetical protein
LHVDINSEDEIDDGVDYDEFGGLHGNRLEANLKWDTETIVNSKDDNENLKVDLLWVIDLENTCLVNFHDFSEFLKVFIEIIFAIFDQEFVTLLLLEATNLIE